MLHEAAREGRLSQNDSILQSAMSLGSLSHGGCTAILNPRHHRRT